MSVKDILKTYKTSKYQELFKIPKKDNFWETPHIKNNIFRPNIIHQCDILYLPQSQFGYKYCLNIVDVYNSVFDGVALKSKTAKAVLNAIKTIYEKHKILQYPIILQFDAGTEFKNEDVKEYLTEHKIDYRYTKTNRHRQNSVVEALNKRLGQLILQFQSYKELDNRDKNKGKKKKIKQFTGWHSHLKEFVQYLNENLRKHRAVYDPLADIQGDKLNLDKNGDIIIDDTDKIPVLSVGTKVKKQLDYPIDIKGKRIDSKFRAGDRRWSEENYIIMRNIINPMMPPLYNLNKTNSKKIDPTTAYTRKQLLVVKNET